MVLPARSPASAGLATWLETVALLNVFSKKKDVCLMSLRFAQAPRLM
jgi:hypothetical protein